MKKHVDVVQLVEITEDRGLYYPIVNINGRNCHCWLITSGNKNADFTNVVRELEETLVDWIDDDENNYGLCFYACGYDGASQQRFARYFEEKYGVNVF